MSVIEHIGPRYEGAEGGVPPTAPAVRPIVGELSPALTERVQLARAKLNGKQALFTELYVLYRNKCRAYREAYRVDKPNMAHDWTAACVISNHPDVRAYNRELESVAAAAITIDVAAILAHDREVIEGHRQIQEMMQRVWRGCRHCHGIKHKYQWIDEDEFCNALASAMDDAAIRKARDISEAPLPNDLGGYGFDAHASPAPECPKCFGDGTQVTLFPDTRLLEGAAAVAFKGIKETKNGIEILTHDVDKAKERLLRAAGAFGDDAASVGKAAAAGAAAGAAAAQALSQRVSTMTPEEKRKAYLSLVG